MDTRETPPEFKDKFMLSFVEIGWANPSRIDPRYKNWTGGRVEIHTYESEFDIDEKHFCTPHTKEWADFMEKYDGEWLDKQELDQVLKTLKEKFYRVDENHNPILD